METATDQAGIEDARDRILHADLTPIEHRILVSFIEQAESPILAACEVLRRVQSHADRPVEDALLGLKKDWHRLVAIVARSTPDAGPDPSFRGLIFQRDQARCILTPPGSQPLAPPEPTFIMPPSLVRLLQDEDGPSRSLMDAFATPSGTSRLLSHLSDTSARGLLANSWLLSPGVSHAFRSGHLQILPRSVNWQEPGQAAVDVQGASSVKYHIMRLYPEPYRAVISLADGSHLLEDDSISSFNLQTEDAKQFPLPDPFLFKIHCKFVNALHHFHVEKSIAEGWQPQPSVSFLDRSLQFIIRRLCPFLPKFIRTCFWRRLFEAGVARYPQDISNIVQQLPFGLYAKSCGRSRHSEPKALQLLERHAPSIPAPRLADVFRMAPAYGFTDGDEDWFVMTAVPGVRVENVLYRMSYVERHRLADDLSVVLDRMHKIPNTTPYRFANVLGGPIVDRRAGGGRNGCGPYNSEADLNAQLAKGVEPYLKREVPTAFSRTHESVFTHGDFFFSNVLVVKGVFSGLIDWEGAGFMPSYWEFTKAMRTSVSKPDAQAIYRHIWGHEFDEELEAERWLWKCFPFGGPE